jgi:tape measure domain-containing protein
MVKKLGNILGNQAQANLVYESMFNVAKSSPYQAKDLIDPVKRFVASGMSLNQSQWLATRQGDLMAGIGGGQDEMGRATLAFQEINAKGYANSRQLNTQLGSLGIPVQKTLESILNVKPEELDKMIKKHQITTDVVMKMVEVLTGPNGMFFESMQKFSLTFQGLQTTIVDEFQRFESDFGDVANDLTKVFYGFVGGSDVWTRVNTYMDEIKQLNHAVISFLGTIPPSQLFGQLQPYFHFIQTEFVQFNKFIGSFFDLVEIPNQGNVYVLNATGEAQIKEYLHDVTLIFDAVNLTLRTLIKSAQIATGLSGVIPGLTIIGNVLGTLFQGAKQSANTDQITNDAMNQTINAALHPDRWPSNVPYFASGGIVNSPTLGILGEAGPEAVIPLSSDNTLDNLNDAITKLNDTLNSGWGWGFGGSGGGLGAGFGGVGGGSGGGRSGGASGALGSWLANTQYGPGVDYVDANGRVHGTPDSDSTKGIGHIHGVAYSLGAGSVAMHAEYAEGVLHLKPGQRFTNPRNGKRQRWGDTSGARNPENIDEFVPANGTTVNVHIHAIDSKSFERTVKDHAKVIQKHLDGESSKRAKLNSKGMV